MTERLYFSEREAILPSRDIEKLSQNFWDGFISHIRTLLKDGSLAEAFPQPCFESPLPFDSNRDSIQKRIQAEVPGFPWEPNEENKPKEDLVILDGVEFFGKYISKVIRREYHDYGRHHHFILFDKEQGFFQYRSDINTLFRRCRHPFELQDNGEIERIGPPVLQEALGIPFETGDKELDRLIKSSIEKFRNPDLEERKVALEKLWDAWERLKTLLNIDKRTGITLLLESAIKNETLRDRINTEGNELTSIGNTFMIRHTEIGKIPITESIEVDYLFHRLFALINLLLRGKTE